MRPVLFDKRITDFSTNGLGRLECSECRVTEERNGIYELEATVPESAELAASIEMDSILYCKPSEGAGMQAFRVYKIEKPIDGLFTVLAQHISYQLSNIPTMPFSITASSSACTQTLAALKSNAVETCPFTFWTDVVTAAPYNQTIPASIRQRLGGIEGSVLDQFGGEYEWDNYTVKLHKARGLTVPAVTLKYGKNITDLSQEEEISSTVTGVCPYWQGEVDGSVVTVTLPERVIESQYADSYAYRRTIPLDLTQDFQNQPTVAQLRTAAQAFINQAGLGIPRVSIDVSFVHLADTEEYKDVAPLETVKLCDNINVYFEKLGISTTAKVVKTVYNVLTEKYESIEVGSMRTGLATTIASQDSAISEMQNVIFKDVDGKIASAINNATAWLTSSGGYVVANKNNDGTWKELFFASSTDLTASSTKVLRINNNGLGFSSTGINGPYTQAWTLDGKLVVGGTNVPSLTVYDNQNNILFQIDKDGMEWAATNSSMTKDGMLNVYNATLSGFFSCGTYNKIELDTYGYLNGYVGDAKTLEIATSTDWSGSITGAGAKINSPYLGIGTQKLLIGDSEHPETYWTTYDGNAVIGLIFTSITIPFNFKVTFDGQTVELNWSNMTLDVATGYKSRNVINGLLI